MNHRKLQAIKNQVEELLEFYEEALEEVISGVERYKIENSNINVLQAEYNIIKKDKTRDEYTLYIIDILMGKYFISLKKLQNIIVAKLKFKKLHGYLLSNIVKDPLYFIDLQENILSFKQIFSIIKEEKIEFNMKELVKKWYYTLVLESSNFYLEKDTILYNYGKIQFDNNKAQKQQFKDVLFNTLHQVPFNNSTLYVLEELQQLERTIGTTLINMFHDQEKSTSIKDETIYHLIKQYEKENSITFTKEQIQAIYGSIVNSFQLITGYPGTGKSTIVDCVLYIYKHVYENITDFPTSVIAPTGLASKGIMDKCNRYINKNICGTIHKMMYSTWRKILYPRISLQEDYDVGEENTNKKKIQLPSTIDFIIIDECSMINIFLLSGILKYVKAFNCKVLMLGDVNQLPPIGCGRPFELIYKSGLFPLIELTEIKRQNGSLSKSIVKMNRRVLHENDFDNCTLEFKVLVKEDKSNEIITEKIKEIYKDNPGRKIHFVTPQHAHSLGNINMNILLKEHHNPNGSFINANYSEGDLIMRTKNDYSDEDNILVNGDSGILIKYREKIYVEYFNGSREKVNDKILKNEFTHFWSSTIHAMQGSQEEIIVVLLDNAHNMWTNNENSKNLLYTAISRCKIKCILLGSWKTFIRAQSPPKGEYFSLFLKEFYDESTEEIYTLEDEE